MSESSEKTSRDLQQPVTPKGTTKKPYKKPKIEWEKKMEPITHALTCALDAENPMCQSATQF